jgi:glutamine phosphoribosylpyrophosphate amidotransferase
MCEQLVARADQPFPIAELYTLTEGLERYGIAGFGWGVAWRDESGSLATYRDVRAFRDDPGRDEIGRMETSSVLIHLRRPSRLSTLTLADTQPFGDPAGRFVFSHNGDLRDYRAYRAAFQAQGRIHGQADTEVGARWLEDAWQPERAVPELLADLHRTFSGPANLAVLAGDGSAYHYAGNAENPVFTFSLGPIRVASTGIYSLDRSLFRYVAPGGRDRHRVGLAETAVLA